MENQNIMEISTIMGIAEPSGPDGVEESDYQETVDTIFKSIGSLKQSFVLIGWCLCRIKEKKWFLKEDCRDIYHFAQKKFKFSQSTTSRCMGLWKMFSKDGETPELDERFDGYSVSQLTEMLPLEMEDLEEFHPGMTVVEIRAKKKKILKERRKLNEGEDYEEDFDDGGDEKFPTSQIEADKESADTYIQPHLPYFQNDTERKKWIGDFKDWGLWYEDENLGIRYYKYDFIDGSRLIAVQYRYTCPPYMRVYPSQHKEEIEADGTYYGEASYHMIFSDWYWYRHEDEYGTEFQRYFTHMTVTIAALIEFLNELQEWKDNGLDGNVYVSNDYVMKELDFDNLDSAVSFGARQYAEFFKKNGYIPPYFNVKNGLEMVDYANTLLEGCGTITSLGAVVSFDAALEVLLILENEDMDTDTAYRQIEKIRHIVKPEEMYKVEQVLEEYRMRESA